MKTKVVVVWLLILVGVPGLLYALGYIPEKFLSKDDSSSKTSIEENIYLPLHPAFVVNFNHQGTLRYLQISLEVMYHQEKVINKIKAQMPAIRNDLILLFSDQQYEKLSSLKGKKLLREEIKQAINQQIGINENAVDDGEVYITNFVMQ